MRRLLLLLIANVLLSVFEFGFADGVSVCHVLWCQAADELLSGESARVKESTGWAGSTAYAHVAGVPVMILVLGCRGGGRQAGDLLSCETEIVGPTEKRSDT